MPISSDHPYYQLLSVCLSHHATLVAVSKTRSIPEIMDLYEAGQRHFGENRVQELTEKATQLPSDIIWHLIGHLQTNKTELAVESAAMVQSVDSRRLFEKLHHHCEERKKKMSCLLQIKIAQEETKYGWSWHELNEWLRTISLDVYPWLSVQGVMGMASLTEDEMQIRSEMKMLKTYFDLLKENHFTQDTNFSVISMGMSGDYRIALEEGSTMVRVGSLLFM